MSGPFACVHCGAAIDSADTNVGTDLALCRTCGKSMPFSAIADAQAWPEPDLSKPPAGITVESSLISGIDFSYRRLNKVVFFLIPFTAVWSGVSLAGIYGSQWNQGKFDLATSLAGLPFLVGTFVLLGVIVFMLFGSWRVHIDRGRARFFVGVGPVGRRHEIALDASTQVRLSDAYVKVRRLPQQFITVTSGDRTVQFGAGLPHDVRVYLAAMLRKASGAG
jgi:hypothetical protein